MYQFAINKITIYFLFVAAATAAWLSSLVELEEAWLGPSRRVSSAAWWAEWRWWCRSRGVVSTSWPGHAGHTSRCTSGDTSTGSASACSRTSCSSRS